MPPKTPRDLSGDELVALLRRRYGYEITRQHGSHMTLTTSLLGTEHHLSVPRHGAVRVGTLRAILAKVADYLGRSVEDVADELFR